MHHLSHFLSQHSSFFKTHNSFLLEIITHIQPISPTTLSHFRTTVKDQKNRLSQNSTKKPLCTTFSPNSLAFHSRVKISHTLCRLCPCLCVVVAQNQYLPIFSHCISPPHAHSVIVQLVTFNVTQESHSSLSLYQSQCKSKGSAVCNFDRKFQDFLGLVHIFPDATLTSTILYHTQNETLSYEQCNQCKTY